MRIPHCLASTYPANGDNMATSIRLPSGAEQRLDYLVSQAGRTKAFYLREIIYRGLDDVEDYYLAAGVLERIRKGQEHVHTSEDVRTELGLGG